MARYKIGITEAGDAGLDLSWEPHLERVDGAILVTKNITPSLYDAALRNKDKVILHATMTGYGSSVLEPEVPALRKELAALVRLVQAGFPWERVVVRIDPIIPTEKGINLAQKVFQLALKEEFTRFRVSVIDMYPHVRERFKKAGLPLPYGPKGFSPNAQQLLAVDEMLAGILNQAPHIRIEACAEPGLKVPIQCGCISDYDLNLLGLDGSSVDAIGPQRKTCMCYSGKEELLNRKSQCGHGCLYCYWR